MHFRNMTSKVSSLVFLASAVAATSLPAADTVADATSTRVVAGIGSADKVLDVTEYAVVTLAGKKTSYDKNIKPNLEIFLYGVATDKPIRFDTVFSSEAGAQLQATIPVSDLKEFVDDNLDPIGIIAKPDRMDKTLYNLSGEVYTGFFRYLPTPVPYAVFFPSKAGLAKDMAHPVTFNSLQTKTQALAFGSLANKSEGIESRHAVFNKYIQTQLEKLTKLSTETQTQYEQRVSSRRLLLDVLGQWFAESTVVDLTSVVDKATGEVRADVLLTPIVGSLLEEKLGRAYTVPSQFAGITAPSTNLLTGRINLPVSKNRSAEYEEHYRKSLKAVQERIDEDTKASAGEKTARKEIISLVIDNMIEGLEKSPSFDAFIDVWPVGSFHTLSMGVGVANPKAVNDVIEKIPAAKEGWKVDLNVEKVGETSIHKLTFGDKNPKSLTDFYGSSNSIYIAVSERAVLLTAGENALATIRDQATIAAQPLPAQGPGELLKFGFNAKPTLKVFQDIKKDPELEALTKVDFRPRLQKASGEAKSGQKESKAGARASELASFEWQETALATLDGNDRIEGQITIDQAHSATGFVTAQKGVLKAFGAVIAKFADDTLK